MGGVGVMIRVGFGFGFRIRVGVGVGGLGLALRWGFWLGLKLESGLRLGFGFGLGLRLSVHSNPYLIFGVYLVRIHKQKKINTKRQQNCIFAPMLFTHSTELIGRGQDQAGWRRWRGQIRAASVIMRAERPAAVHTSFHLVTLECCEKSHTVRHGRPVRIRGHTHTHAPVLSPH